MANFVLYKSGKNYKTVSIEKDTATVIAAGDLVTLDGSKLAISAVAASTAVAFAPNGAGAGDLNIEVTIGDDFELKGTGDAAFAESMRGTEVDITNAQLIDVATSTTDVLKISIAEEAGTVGSTDDIVVRVNKPLF